MSDRDDGVSHGSVCGQVVQLSLTHEEEAHLGLSDFAGCLGVCSVPTSVRCVDEVTPADPCEKRVALLS